MLNNKVKTKVISCIKKVFFIPTQIVGTKRDWPAPAIVSTYLISLN